MVSLVNYWGSPSNHIKLTSGKVEANPGDYKTTWVGDTPVIVNRDSEYNILAVGWKAVNLIRN